MSDDLRRAYLLGESHSLYGNLPGTEHASPAENATTYAFAAMPRPFENRNDQWPTSQAGGRPAYATARPLKPDGTLNLQEKTWSGATYVLAPCPKTTDPPRREVYGPRTCHRINPNWQWEMEKQDRLPSEPLQPGTHSNPSHTPH